MKKTILAALVGVVVLGAVVALLVWRAKHAAPVSPVVVGAPDAAGAEVSIVFVARTDPPSLWRVSSAGKVAKLPVATDEMTTETSEGDDLPHVSPEGTRVAVFRNQNMLVTDLAGGAAIPVTTEGRDWDNRYAAVEILWRAWSPDGTRILFHVGHGMTEDPEGEHPDLELRKVDYGDYVFDLSTRQRMKVTLPESVDVIAWLPDGALLVARDDGGTIHLSRFRLGDAKPVPLALPPSGYGQVRVGRSARYAVAADGTIGKDSRIVRFALDKPVPEGVTITGAWAEYQWPHLSPSEEQVAFQRGKDIWVRDHLVFQPQDALQAFDWIDDHTLVIESVSEVVVVGVQDRQVRGRVAVAAQ